MESSACASRLSRLSFYLCSAGSPAASPQPSCPSSSICLLHAHFSHGAPNASSRPCAFTFPLGTGHFLPRPLTSHLTSTSDICLGLLPLSWTVPCIGYPHEIFASPRAIAVVFGNWHGIMSNSPARSQIPTNPIRSTEYKG